MTQPIDVAYVDVVVRDKSLAKVEKDIKDAFDGIDKDIDKDLKSIEDNFDDLFKKLDKRFVDLEKNINGVWDEVVASTDRLTGHIDKSFEGTEKSVHRRFKNIENDVSNVAHRLENRFIDPLREGLQKFGTAIGGIFSELFKAAGQLGSIIAGSPLVVLIALLTPVVIGLVAALSQLAGLVALLPAGIGLLVASIVPAIVAFQNFGDAVSALASGDIQKIDEALKKLSPSARLVAREVAALLPVLKSFQRAIQEAFFSQVRGSFTQLVSVLPLIQTSFGRIATSLGVAAREFVTFVTSLNAVNALNDLFNTTALIIDRLAPSLFKVLDSISVSVSAALPFVLRLANAFGTALDKFSAFLNRAIATGDFDRFIENAFTTFKELLDLVKALGGLLGTLFAGTVESGHDFIQTLTDVITRLDTFLKSAEGQDVLRDLSRIIKLVGGALESMVSSLIFLDQQFRVSLAVLEKVGRGFFKLLEIIGDFFGKVPAKVNELGAFLARIPELIGSAISSAIDTAFRFIGVQIGLTLFAIQVLPGKIVDFFTSLPERIGQALASTGPTILDIFRQAFDQANAFIVQKFDEAVAFIESVPDRIIALGPVFLRAGKNLITSFMNGFRSVGSFIGDIAGDIVGSVRSFLNRAIDKINSGIAAIDDILPGSLARIPRLAGGGVVGRRRGGTLAVVGEGGEDEVVAPISTLEDILKKTFGGDGGGAMTVNFTPGSISISFSGVTPTEGEARSVGRAVGDGIAEQLLKRNVRTQVRAA